MNRRAAFVYFALALVSYGRDIKPLLDRSCVECHSYGADLNLSEFPFAGVGNQTAITARMLAKVSASPATMPPGNRPKLQESEVATLRAWRDGGLAP